MRRILKYPLEIIDNQTIKIPGFVCVMSVIEQRDIVVLYSMVNDTEPTKKLDIRIIGTGNPVDIDIGLYDFIGTVNTNDGRLIWHIFAKKVEEK